ncbi:MAG: DUF5655 domain-containing protein [Anaerolineales bacterium]
MSNLDQARETQLKNIQTKTGKSLAEFRAVIDKSGLNKHGEIRKMLMDKFGLGYGDANSLVHFALLSDGQSAAQAKEAPVDDVLAEIYAGGRASLRPIHDRLIAAIQKFGAFEIVPKKGYVSLRRKKQFAMIGPASKGRVELGLNMKDVKATSRLSLMAPGGMVQYQVDLTSPGEVDKELITWIRKAFDSAG